MKDPSLHEPSKKVLEMHTCVVLAFLDGSPQKGQNTTSLPITKPKRSRKERKPNIAILSAIFFQGKSIDKERNTESGV